MVFRGTAKSPFSYRPRCQPAGARWARLDARDQARRIPHQARRADGRVGLLTRKGYNFSNRFPQIVAALTVLSVRSCLIDSEAVVCNESGLAVSRPTPPGRRLAAVLELRRINLLERAVRRTPSHLVNELLTKDEARRIAAIFAHLQDLLRKRD
jgi:hypothetical protein